MLRIIRSKPFIIIAVTVLLLVLLGISGMNNSRLTWLNNIVSVPMKPLQSAVTSIGQSLKSGLSYFGDMDEVKTENEVLKTRVAELEKANRELVLLEEKNNELREALNLKDEFGDYSIIGANIIAVEPGNWFNVFTIDIGTREGIEVDYPVVTGMKGLVGKILTADYTSSKVLTIIDEDSAAAAFISKSGGGHAVVRGDINLKELGFCRLDFIPLDVDVEVGDNIETSGLGGIFPKGITIGKVIEVRKSSSELNRYAVIEPTLDFKQLEEVYVLKNISGNEPAGSVLK